MGTLVVFFRDVEHLYGVFIMILRYTTPIFYPPSVIPSNFSFIYKFNPIYAVIASCRTVFMDGTILANTPQHKLMSYFLDNQNTIFILEDCEKALKDRNDVYSGYNNVMPILLNITDGVIADVLGIKLICTFNTSLDKIDKALLRKGRLSLKYEFKKLTKDKVANILGHNVDKDMSLAEIYNIEEENDFSKKIQKKIGFN